MMMIKMMGRQATTTQRRLQYEAERFNDAYDIFALSKWLAFGCATATATFPAAIATATIKLASCVVG